VLSELPVVLGWIGLLVCGALWLVFRKPREVLLSLATLLLSVGVLMAVMRTAGWSWNMMNLMAVPLLFGLGVDYSIHIQLALRRHHGDLAAVRQSVGRALLLAGGTTITAFGSLAFSSNAGLASLGRVCAVGITATMLIAVYLLPGWWRAWARKEQGAEQAP
jgi:predicted RND superfamily exporter protein